MSFQTSQPSSSYFSDVAVTTVNIKARTETLQARKKPPIIYHKLSVPRPYSAMKVQIKMPNHQSSTMVMLLRHSKMPTVKECDRVKIVRNINNLEGEF